MTFARCEHCRVLRPFKNYSFDTGKWLYLTRGSGRALEQVVAELWYNLRFTTSLNSVTNLILFAGVQFSPSLRVLRIRIGNM